MTSCALVVEDTGEPGEDASFCAIWLDLPMLSDCSPPTLLASDPSLMSPMMMIRPPISTRQRRLLSRSPEAARDGKQPICSARAFAG